MKKISVLLLAALALAANAQNKIDAPGRIAIDKAHRLALESDKISGDNIIAPLSVSNHIPEKHTVIVEFLDDSFDFGDVDVEVLSTVGNMAIVEATAFQMEQIAELPQVFRVSMGYEAKLSMNAARKITGVDDVHTGAGELAGTPYTGKGVIAGLYDSGFDVNHIAFLDEEGKPRTKVLFVYGKNSGSYTTPDQIAAFTTEDKTSYHGTHVLGIMAGGYKGPSTYAVMDGTRAKVTKQDAAGSSNPYYGVATEADIAIAGGDLGTTNILRGVSNVVNYAKDQKKPCVVNISLGNNIGPHDGTDAFSRALDQYAENAIICVAAGNEGEITDRVSIYAGGPTSTFITSNTLRQCYGVIDLWGSSSDVFEVRFIGYNRNTGKEVFSYTVEPNKTTGSGAMEGFSSYFNGSFTVTASVDPGNNRYNVYFAISNYIQSKEAAVLPGLVITPKSGQYVDGFITGDNLEFVSNSVPGFTAGGPDNSINGLGCGNNVLSVGSFTSTNKIAIIGNSENGTTSNVGGSVGDRSSFSSYGVQFNGRTLPDVCAPGEQVVAAYNKYYFDYSRGNARNLPAYYTGTTRDSHWINLQGTSMASPFAAGVIATWLQADPSLKIKDIREVIANTADNDMFTLMDPDKFGAGKINALEGLKYILKNSAGVTDVAVDTDKAIITSNDGYTYEVFVAGAKKISASIYSLSGLTVAQAVADNDTLNISARNVAPGVYVLAVATDKGTESHKITIR